MTIAESILLAVRRLSLVGSRRILLQVLQRTLPGHFKVDADAAVQEMFWEVDAEVPYASLDNLGNLLPAAVLVLFVGNTHLGVTTLGCEKVGDSNGQMRVADIRRDRVEPVDLVLMFVLDRNPRTFTANAGVRVIGGDNLLVEEVIVGLVLFLF